MIKAALTAWFLLLAGIIASTQAQFFTPPINIVSTPATGYTGPGDVVSGAQAWWGLRCYNTAYTGNVADVYAPLDASHTLLTCSAGGTINETLQALSTTCAVSCTIKTLYDQTGGNKCGGTCNLVQSMIANRPAFTLSCIGSKPCGSCVAASSPAMTTSSGFASPVISAPFTESVVANANSTNAAQQTLFVPGDGGGNAGIVGFHSSGAGVWWFYNGTSNTVTLADNAFHAAQYVVNDPSSVIYTDGSSVSVTAGTNSSNGVGSLCTRSGETSFMTGNFTEIGVWLSAFTGGQQSAMNSNQHTYWGF